MTGGGRARPTAWYGHGDLASSLVLILPVWLAYAAAVVFATTSNRADLVSRGIWALCGGERAPYLVVHAVLAALALAWARRAGRGHCLALAVVVPVRVEATLYALTLAVALGALVAALPLGAQLDHVVTALGAGVHEELVFRLALFAGGAVVLTRAGVAAPRLAWLIALVGSSVLFAAAHHLGPHAEAWSGAALVFRALAGLGLALVCWYRSLAHAVYAHTLFDLYVLVVR